MMEQSLLETRREILIVQIYRRVVERLTRRDRAVQEYTKRTSEIIRHINSLEKYTFPTLELLLRSGKIDIDNYLVLANSFLNILKVDFQDDYKQWLLDNHNNLGARYVERQVVKIEIMIDSIESKINKTVYRGPLRAV